MPIIRVHWTDKEFLQVIHAAATKLNEGYNLGEALVNAQQCLPEERQRPIASLYASKQLVKAVRKLADNLANKPITLAQVTHPEPQPEAPKDTSIEDLIQLIAAKLAGAMKTEIVKVVKELEHEFKVTKHNPEYETERQKLPKIVIIGLRGEQAAIIGREYGAQYTFKFLHTDDAKHQSATDADAYLLMKNFISHSVFERYQIFKNHVLIDGGMTALRGWLSTEGSKLKEQV
jgi:hypothetical protein